MKYQIIFGFFLILVFLYPIPYTLYPAFAEVSITNTFGFGNITSLGDATSTIITPMFSVATLIVVLYFLFAAFRYLTAGGNKEQIDGAKQMITHAIIGFFILIIAFFLLEFIPQFFNLTGIAIIK